MNKLFYIHDPMCSWCWGFVPSWKVLETQLSDQLDICYLLGGLAEESDQPMEPEMQRYLQQTWRKIEQQIPSQTFNHDFWKSCVPRRSTYPACRAIIAARELEPSSEKVMIEAIQQAYYRRALNPSDKAVLVQLAGELDLNQAQFSKLLQNQSVEETLQQEIQAARALGVNSFPSLILVTEDETVTPISVDYNRPETMLRSIKNILEYL